MIVLVGVVNLPIRVRLVTLVTHYLSPFTFHLLLRGP